ncbi:ATP-dependent Clp protease ATP-binding subunit, partial [Pyxidicoccus fallax]
MVDSTDLAQVLHEANDIAQSVVQRLTSAHVLLALFTVENRAQLLLKERGVDEDSLLQLLTSAPTESDGVVRELREKTREIATSLGSGEADCLHLLIAVTRVRCAANELLQLAGLDLATLRTTAMAFFTSGRMPRFLQTGRAQALGHRPPVSRPVGAPPSPLPLSAVAVSMPRAIPGAPPTPLPSRPSRSTPALSPRDLIDVDDSESVSSAPVLP